MCLFSNGVFVMNIELLFFIYVLAVLPCCVQGISELPPAIHTFDYVKTPQLTILPKPFSSRKESELSTKSVFHPKDHVKLTFNVFNRTFFLYLEPNDIFHPEFMTTLVHSDTSSTSNDDKSKASAVNPFANIKVYKGVVFDQTVSSETHLSLQYYDAPFSRSIDRLPIGEARITFYNDGKHKGFVSPFEKEGAFHYPHSLLQPLPSYHNPIFEGHFEAFGDVYNIQPIHIYQASKRPDDPDVPLPEFRHQIHKEANMIIYKDGDRKRNPNLNKRSWDGVEISERGKCGFEDQPFKNPNPEGLIQGLFKRADAGCPSTMKIAYLGIAADCTYVMTYKTIGNALTRIVSNINSASKVYESTFNIKLALHKVDLNAICDTGNGKAWNRDCDQSYDITTRLSDFSRWRGTMTNDGIAVWHLVSRCSTASTVGIAWLGQLCQSTANDQIQGGTMVTVSGTGVSTVNKEEWKVMAHEIGHNFGARHDCTASNCPCTGSSCTCCQCDGCDCKEQYIMNPTNDAKTGTFSPCSQTEMCAQFRSISSCLVDFETLPQTSVGVCGNGIKEGNEQCDCGSDQECESDPCCNSNCTLKPGMSCSDKNSECCQQCQFKAQGTTCRPKRSNDCDVQEVCTGNSADCPSDNYVTDGTSCGSNGDGTVCSSGYCTNRLFQCQSRGVNATSYNGCSSFSTSCEFYCPSQTSSGSCVKIGGFFLDGTPCGIGGFCQLGTCTASVSGTVAFILNNKWVLAAIIIASLIVLAAIIYFIVRCIKRRKAKKATEFNYVPRNFQNMPSPEKPVESTLPEVTDSPLNYQFRNQENQRHRPVMTDRQQVQQYYSYGEYTQNPSYEENEMEYNVDSHNIHMPNETFIDDDPSMINPAFVNDHNSSTPTLPTLHSDAYSEAASYETSNYLGHTSTIRRRSSTRQERFGLRRRDSDKLREEMANVWRNHLEHPPRSSSIASRSETSLPRLTVDPLLNASSSSISLGSIGDQDISLPQNPPISPISIFFPITSPVSPMEKENIQNLDKVPESEMYSLSHDYFSANDSRDKNLTIVPPISVDNGARSPNPISLISPYDRTRFSHLNYSHHAPWKVSRG